jgi:hypothetical protein
VAGCGNRVAELVAIEDVPFDETPCPITLGNVARGPVVIDAVEACDHRLELCLP